MVPTAKKKMQTFIQQHEGGGPAINPHGPSSPPRPVVNQQSVISAPSPPKSRQGRQAAAEAMKIPVPTTMTSRFGTALQPTSSPPGVHKSIEQQGHEKHRGGTALHALQAASEGQQDGGLRELWEAQSAVHSLFSDDMITRPASRQNPVDDAEDANSDILNDRGLRRGRIVAHRSADSAPFFKYQNGHLEFAPGHQKGFSNSMISLAPPKTRVDASIFQRDPFGSTSNESSPQPQRDPSSFMRSKFPIRGSEENRIQAHHERPSFPSLSARRSSPRRYEGTAEATLKPATDIVPKATQPTALQTAEKALGDWDGEDSDISSQGYEIPEQARQHQRTPKKARQRAAVPDDATVVLHPQKPPMQHKAQKTVFLQDEASAESPIPSRSTKKRRRSIDYDDEVLQRMSFSELQSEPFDHDPAREVIESPARPPAHNLGDRLNFYMRKDGPTQAQFFAQMSVQEWEDSGDWFLDRFSHVVKRMKEARQMKRQMMSRFEVEVSSREEEVRCRKERIDRKLSKLKHDGNAMMKGNQSQD